MRFGITVPNIDGFADPAFLVQLAHDAEAAGWDGFFLWDHMIYRRPWKPIIDPWVALGAVAAVTSTIQLGTAVTPLPRRRPWKVAREVATLDHLSDGRAVLGVGLGAPNDEFDRFGEESDARVRAEKLDESLAIVHGLWTGEPFSFKGSHYTVDEVRFLPKPLQRPRVPIWVAGRWPRPAPFRRAGRWDGVFPINADGSDLTTGQVRDVIRLTTSHRPSDARPLDVILEGTSSLDEESAERMAAYEGAGATWWLESLTWDRGALEESVERVSQGPPLFG